MEYAWWAPLKAVGHHTFEMITNSNLNINKGVAANLKKPHKNGIKNQNGFKKQKRITNQHCADRLRFAT